MTQKVTERNSKIGAVLTKQMNKLHLIFFF